MSNVLFVAPFFMETTLRFVDAVAGTPGVRLGLISQDPLEKLPPALASRLAGHYRAPDALDADGLVVAVEALGRRLGSVDRLLGTLEELQVPLGVVRDRLGIRGMGAEAAENFRDKARMKSVLRDAGLPCARHALATTAGQARAFAEGIGYPVIVKPPAGSGARSTFRIEDPQGLDACLATMPPSPSAPALLEEFVTGREHSFDSIFVDGRMVWYSVNHYYPTPLEVLRTPWIQWCVLSPREVDDPRYHDIRDAAVQALRVLGLETGLSHMEWFRRDDGTFAISEVGARPPGAQFTTLASYAGDFDLYAAWARVMVHGEFIHPGRPYAAGAAFLKGQGRGRVKRIAGIEEAQRELGHLVVEARLPKIGQLPTGTYEGEGYVILRSPSTEIVEEGLARLVRGLRVELG